MKKKLINLAYKTLSTIRNRVFMTFNVKTIGARALVIQDDKVLLIKHTYKNGWYTIGGGVKKNESTQTAIVRELFEEVGVTPTEEPKLFAIYHNSFEKRDDYIAFYIVQKFKIEESYSFEIEEKKWFSFNALPPEITPSTKRRIEEFLDQRQTSDRW